MTQMQNVSGYRWLHFLTVAVSSKTIAVYIYILLLIIIILICNQCTQCNHYIHSTFAFRIFYIVLSILGGYSGYVVTNCQPVLITTKQKVVTKW